MTAVQALFTVVIGLWLAMRASWKLTLPICVVAPILGLGLFMVSKAKKVDTAAMAMEMGPLTSEVFENIRTVASLGIEEQVKEKFERALENLDRSLIRANIFRGFANGVTNMIVYVVFAGIFGTAVVYIDHDWMEPDNVLKVLFPLMYSFVSLSSTQTWAADRQKAKDAVTKIFNTIDREPRIDVNCQTGEKITKLSGRIEFRSVVFHYPTRPAQPVLRELSLVVEARTTAAFVGVSGSGKSTVIALLQRFYDPQQGAVLLDGLELPKLNLSWLRSQMALVQQEPVLFGGTIRENIAYGREGATQQEVEQAARLANAHDFITSARFPKGYDTSAGEKGGQLSGGEKQRIAIARAVVRDPTILLLDEATAALDTESERLVQDALNQLLHRTRRTTLVIAHRLSTIQSADQIFMIGEGKVVERGTHEELLRIDQGHYRKLVSGQDSGSP